MMVMMIEDQGPVTLVVWDGIAGRSYVLWLNGESHSLLGPVDGSLEDEARAREIAKDIVSKISPDLAYLVESAQFKHSGLL